MQACTLKVADGMDRALPPSDMQTHAGCKRVAALGPDFYNAMSHETDNSWIDTFNSIMEQQSPGSNAINLNMFNKIVI